MLCKKKNDVTLPHTPIDYFKQFSDTMSSLPLTHQSISQLRQGPLLFNMTTMLFSLKINILKPILNFLNIYYT